MDKKTYVLKVLNVLKDSLPLAAGFKVMIENSDIDDAILDMLIEIFSHTIDTIEDKKIKKQLEQSKGLLEELKQEEKEEEELNQKDIEKLDEMLLNI